MKVIFTILVGFLLANTHGARLKAKITTSDSESAVSLVSDLLKDGTNVRFSHVINAMIPHVSFKSAAATLTKEHTVPKEVANLLQGGKTADKLDDASLQKARIFLNGLVESAYPYLDELIVRAKEFEYRNRGSEEQVSADIARLGQQIAGHIGDITAAQQCMRDKDAAIDAVREREREEYNAWYEEWQKNYADLVVKQNDLDVFDFLIQTTKKICDEQATSKFIQEDDHAAVQMCDGGGSSTLRFKDATLQKKFDRMLMKGSRDLLRNVLAKHTPSQAPSFVQEVESKQQPTASKTPVISGMPDAIGDLKCSRIPDCGLLYDTLSIEWGGYKDAVDELKKTMADNQAAWDELQKQFNDQVETLTAQKKQCSDELASATAKKNADEQELAERELQKRKLDHEHRITMADYKVKIQRTFQQDICGPIVIRNEIMLEADTCATKDIDDCEMSTWHPTECSVTCDNLCPVINQGQEAFKTCGGINNLVRRPILVNNSCGINCGVTSKPLQCNQKKCPVECEVSQYSGWGKCSKDCEGGVKGRTRNVLTKPMYGGKICPSVVDTETCNMESCDRDCTLTDWTVWSPCSMACSGGNQQRQRNVIVPIRANGKCPKETSRKRLENQDCNTHQCAGDEICIASQDLVLSIDASGSLNAEDWKMMQNYTQELLERYQANYYGQAQVQLGAVQFGNGVIESDGTISKAVLLSELSFEFSGVKTAVKDMAHLQGFTNLAQAFKLGQKLLTQRGRRESQAAILTISDGKPSFLWETKQVADDLDDKGIMKYMVVVAEFPKSDAWKFMKSIATQPHETNTVRVPGWEALADGGGPFVQEALVKFCPAAHSPSQTLEIEKQRGFMLVYEKGYCGGLGRTLGTNIFDPEDCFHLTQSKGRTGFSMGRKYRKGKCSVELLSFTCDNYAQWQTNPDAPECPTSWSGGFHNSKYYDWYALEPNCES